MSLVERFSFGGLGGAFSLIGLVLTALGLITLWFNGIGDLLLVGRGNDAAIDEEDDDDDESIHKANVPSAQRVM